MSFLAEQTPYEVLEVPVEASVEQIEAAYAHMTSMVKDDSLALYAMMGEDETRHIRTLVEEAYALLSDPMRRQAYDATQRRFAGLKPRDPGAVTARLQALSRLDEREREPIVRALHPAGPPSLKVTGGGAKPDLPAPSRRTLFAAKTTETLDETTNFSGPQLRRLRESAGATLDDLGELTKVGRRYLLALESDDFSALPAAVYVRGFLTQYARSLGLDPRLVVKSYMTHWDAASAP